MVKIFLDANVLIDIFERPDKMVDFLDLQELYVSPLAFHILAYLYHYKMPSEKLQAAIDNFLNVPFDREIAYRATTGPTADFEDNVQLQSAAVAECDYFLTHDKQLLKLGFFGNVRMIASPADI